MVESYDQQDAFSPARQVAQIPQIDLPKIATGEEEVDDLLEGGFVRGTRVLIWGRGGSGKSRLAMRWASATVNAVYISLEMFEPIAAHAARSAGANPKRLFITESFSRFRKNAREMGAEIVVLDSISVVPREQQKSLLSDLKRWAEQTGGVAIVICHQNKRGLYAGSHVIQHWGDLEIFLKAGKTRSTLVEVLKSRSCPLGVVRTTLGVHADAASDESAEHEPN